jgi:hypothetical protein
VRPADQHRQVLDGEVLLAHPAEVHAVGFDAGEAGQREGGRFVGVPAVTAARKWVANAFSTEAPGFRSPLNLVNPSAGGRSGTWYRRSQQAPSAGKSPRG